MLRVLIVDDEPYAHDVLAHHCGSDPGITIVGNCRSAAEALREIAAGAVDLMFLDIRMPRFGGLDLLRGLTNPPLTVIVSAHQEHALAGFDLDVVDYLLKPVSAERFRSALDKVRRRIAEGRGPPADEADDLMLKVDRALRRFPGTSLGLLALLLLSFIAALVAILRWIDRRQNPGVPPC